MSSDFQGNYEMLTDLYQLTMAQAYLEAGIDQTPACFHMHFRDYPFSGGFVIASGIAQLKMALTNFGFSESDIEYLRSVPAPNGETLFSEEFLATLSSLKLSVSIDCIREGEVVFPNEPLLRISGPLIQCQLLETLILNCINFESLIATKAARICLAAKTPVAEFGLRRAQGPAGGIWASRGAYVGGCASTSNVLAGKLFNIPVSGTHAHSWVMSFPDELTAFRAYAESFPQNCTLLVDTYNVEQGIRNAIVVGLEMEQRGEHLSAIRIDSGDLAWLAKKARKMLDEAGLTQCGIVLSNDLDEYTITSINSSGAQVNAWGVGTKLACAFDNPSLGGVFKLSALWDNQAEKWIDRLKLTNSTRKLTTPGLLNIRRYYSESGHLAGDMVFDINTGVGDGEVIVDPMDDLRRKKLAGLSFETLFITLMKEGVVQMSDEELSAQVARERAQRGLEKLDETQKRILNPHTYPVGLEEGLFDRRRDLVMSLRDRDEDLV